MTYHGELMAAAVERDLVRADNSCLSQFKEFLSYQTSGEYVVKKVESLKSAQQRVFIVTVGPPDPPGTDEQQLTPRQTNLEDSAGHDTSILNAINEGRGKLVLRIWKGSARWWNLNSNKSESCSVLAKAEVAGYKLARHAFEMYHSQMKMQPAPDHPLIYIPKVLHFHSETKSDTHSDAAREDDCQNPWAVFSYAKESERLHKAGKSWEYCDEFIFNMVKIRKEFGFDEPHPRHGRVCIEDALEYTMHVLEAVVFPIHGAFYSHFLKPPSHEEGLNHFESFQREIASLKENGGNTMSGGGFTYEDMIHKHQNTILYLKEEASKRDINEQNILSLIDILEKCIGRLSLEWINCKKDHFLPPVLCHMDLQPQNMILCRHKEKSTKVPKITSVLDWEEAFLADPRFEILLLCRKVVANREQADVIWNHYSQGLERLGLQSDKMGSIEPWLKLETVHSLLTMSLQGMNLQGGGRNPWEGKSDLWEKITRELQRLNKDFGWTFCNM